MRLPKARRRWIAGAVLLIAVVGVVRGVGQGTRLDHYRIIDDRTVVVGTTAGPWEWLRVAGVTETTASVIIEASALDVPLPGFRDTIAELTVDLRDSIGSRSVIDASSGLRLDLAPCPPPDVYGCSRNSPSASP
jgi:hypothetical protein